MHHLYACQVCGAGCGLDHPCSSCEALYYCSEKHRRRHALQVGAAANSPLESAVASEGTAGTGCLAALSTRQTSEAVLYCRPLWNLDMVLSTELRSLQSIHAR